MINIKGVSYTYPSGTQALKKVSIELPQTHIFAIMGASGSGKTTLLKCIGKFLRPQQGKIRYNEQDIFDIPDAEFRKLIGIVFQQLYLFPHLTVLENMMLAPQKVYDLPENKAKNNSLDMLEKLGIQSLAYQYPAQISGGQAQRAAIARALVLKPAYLLLDEPTSALDVKTANEFGEWLVDLKEKTTFVIVTHDILFTRDVATSGVLIKAGEIQATGPMDTILRDHYPDIKK